MIWRTGENEKKVRIKITIVTNQRIAKSSFLDVREEDDHISFSIHL
jgi:hypothetical protein